MRRIHILLILLASSAFLFGQQQYPQYPQYPAVGQGAPPQGYPQQGYPQQGYPQQGPQQQGPQQQGQDPQDQPGQPVARLSVINGDASVRRGDSGEWVAAILNAPLMAGDSISIAPGGSAEMQLDNANFIRLGGDSEVRISQLDNGRQQLQVSKGLVTWRVLRDLNGSNPQSEISTPAVAVHPLRLAAVRVEVAADGATRIVVRHGDAEISTPRGTERIHEGNMMMVRGAADDPEYQVVYAPARDGWDNWNDQRDAWLERAQSNRYVSPDITGTEDLDANGRWGYDPAYGNVWTPNVPPTWAPYRNGQWVWEDYYGWTWVDYDPWGWAPFHYGSWYFRTGFGWSWFPGQRYGHYWYRPAMVGFFGFGGGIGVGFGFGNVGWVPLAPFEVYRPWYGPGWFGGGRFGGSYGAVNVNLVRNANIVNTYRNARFANGVTAVSAQDFQRGAFRNQIAVNAGQLQQASLVRGAVPIAPTASNLRFSERAASAASIPRGTPAAGNQRFFSRMPASGNGQRTSFTQQQSAVRSAIGGGAASQASASGWQRFGEPSQSGAGGGVQSRAFQSGGSPAGGANGRAGEGWNRFGSPQSTAPQRSAAPAQGQYSRPAYNYNGRSAYQGSGGQARSLQVAPPMVQQRSAPSSGSRGAPQGNRGGGNARSSGGGHSGRR